MYPTFKDMILAHPLPLFLFWLPGAVWLASRISPNWDSAPPEGQLAVIATFALWGIPTLLALPKVWWHLYQKRKSARAGIDPELLAQRRRIWQGWLLALFALAAFEYELFFLSHPTDDQNFIHYSTALVIVASLSFLPFVLFYRSTRSGSSYFLLLVVCVSGFAGLWQLSEHPDFLLEHSESSFFMPLTAALCAIVPPLMVVVTILLRALTWLRVRGATPITSKENPFAVTWCLPVPRHSPHAAAIEGTLPDYCKQLLATQKPKIAA